MHLQVYHRYKKIKLAILLKFSLYALCIVYNLHAKYRVLLLRANILFLKTHKQALVRKIFVGNITNNNGHIRTDDIRFVWEDINI